MTETFDLREMAIEVVQPLTNRAEVVAAAALEGDALPEQFLAPEFAELFELTTDLVQQLESLPVRGVCLQLALDGLQFQFEGVQSLARLLELGSECFFVVGG